MTKSAEIKEALEEQILKGLQAAEPTTPFLAVARQFLKDFPPDGVPVGPDAEGVLGQYANRIREITDASEPQA